MASEPKMEADWFFASPISIPKGENFHTVHFNDKGDFIFFLKKFLSAGPDTTYRR